MKRIIFVVAILLILSFTLSARKAQKVNVVCGPYIQCATETSFVVTWVTDIDAVAWVEVAPDDGTHFYNKEREKYYSQAFGAFIPLFNSKYQYGIAVGWNICGACYKCQIRI